MFAIVCPLDEHLRRLCRTRPHSQKPKDVAKSFWCFFYLRVYTKVVFTSWPRCFETTLNGRPNDAINIHIVVVLIERKCAGDIAGNCFTRISSVPTTQRAVDRQRVIVVLNLRLLQSPIETHAVSDRSDAITVTAGPSLTESATSVGVTSSRGGWFTIRKHVGVYPCRPPTCLIAVGRSFKSVSAPASRNQPRRPFYVYSNAFAGKDDTTCSG